MPIISKDTWDKFTQEEKEKLRSIYLEAKKVGTRNIRELEEYFGKENLQQPKPKEYWEIEEELFNHRANQWLSYYIIDWDKPHSTATQIVKSDCTSRKQCEKLLAINKLLNVAKFLNKNEDGTPWKPDFSDANEDKWFPCIGSNGKIEIHYATRVNYEIVYFRTEELAKQAIQILGEDTVRLALSSDY